MDYRKFLGQSEERVLPYFGGPFVDAPDRRLRVAEQFEPAGAGTGSRSRAARRRSSVRRIRRT